MNAKINRRSKSTATQVVDPAAQAAAKVAAAEMAAMLIAEEEDQKHLPHAKQGTSNKAQKHRNRKKTNPDELDTGFKGPDEAISVSIASSTSGRRDNVRERDGMGGDASYHNQLDGEVDAHGAEESEGLVFHSPPSATLPSAIDSAENENTCIICLAAPNSSLLLPCNHQVMCAECATEVLSSGSRPQCLVCGARAVIDCIYF
jgi:hypothetical protein